MSRLLLAAAILLLPGIARAETAPSCAAGDVNCRIKAELAKAEDALRQDNADLRKTVAMQRRRIDLLQQEVNELLDRMAALDSGVPSGGKLRHKKPPADAVTGQ